MSTVTLSLPLHTTNMNLLKVSFLQAARADSTGIYHDLSLSEVSVSTLKFNIEMHTNLSQKEVKTAKLTNHKWKFGGT